MWLFSPPAYNEKLENMAQTHFKAQ